MQINNADPVATKKIGVLPDLLFNILQSISDKFLFEIVSFFIYYLYIVVRRSYKNNFCNEKCEIFVYVFRYEFDGFVKVIFFVFFNLLLYYFSLKNERIILQSEDFDPVIQA